MAEPRVGNVQTEDREELRLALVMTGGLSLAVWMGGVAEEISRLTRRVGVYGRLLDLTGTDARVDVISGSSAGGLNGALLALAVARDRGLETVKKLWLEKGSFMSLFRSPLEPDPPSLLKGDEYFLRELVKAFRSIDGEPGARSDDADGAPIDLIITTSLLSGKLTRYADDFGSVISDVSHDAQFRFSRGNLKHHLRRPDPGRSECRLTCIHEQAWRTRDDFAEPEIAARLGLAARCSASFPFAFEPSLCPVGETTTNPDRPDMRCHATFRKTQFTVDGGVLVNKPIGLALRSIYEQGADRQVRRVLAYVVPDPGVKPATGSADVPSLFRTVVDSVVTLPRNESIGLELGSLRERNEKARGQQRLRLEWLVQGSLEQRAVGVFDEYRRIRAEASVEYILSALERGVARSRDEIPGWDRARLRSALTPVRLRYLPDSFPGRSWSPNDSWAWGLQPVEDTALAALDLLRRGLQLVVPSTDGAGSEAALAAAAIRSCRDQLHMNLDRFRSLLRGGDRRYWEDQGETAYASMLEAQSSPPAAGRDALSKWAEQTFKEWPLGSTSPAEIAVDTASILVKADGPLRALIGPARSDPQASQPMKEEAGTLESMLDALGSASGQGECLHRLLALHVLETVLLPFDRVQEQIVELIQISGETPNYLGGPTEIREKLAGIQLGHFGAFFKRSWRANDWMWGRLDAANRLTQVLLNPDRLRQRRLSRAAVVDVLESVALGDGETRSALTGSDDAWDKAEVEDELAFLDHPEMPLPPTLPASARAVARRVQLDIACEELRDVARAIEWDLEDGAARRPSAVTFTSEIGRVEGREALPPADALRLFPSCKVGAETMEDEAGSDLFARATGTAAAVGTSVGRGRRSGFVLPLRTLLASLRGFALTLWVMTRSAVQGSRAGAALVTGMLAVGGALLALAVLMNNPPTLIVTVGAAVLAAGFTLAAIRAGVLLALVGILSGLAVAALPALVARFAGLAQSHEGAWWADSVLWVKANQGALAPIFVVVGVVLGAILLGLLHRRPRRSKT
ncbi:MAG: patatin-like protein [Actinomycetota bacterium]